MDISLRKGPQLLIKAWIYYFSIEISNQVVEVKEKCYQDFSLIGKSNFQALQSQGAVNSTNCISLVMMEYSLHLLNMFFFYPMPDYMPP